MFTFKTPKNKKRKNVATPTANSSSFKKKSLRRKYNDEEDHDEDDGDENAAADGSTSTSTSIVGNGSTGKYVSDDNGGRNDKAHDSDDDDDNVMRRTHKKKALMKNKKKKRNKTKSSQGSTAVMSFAMDDDDDDDGDDDDGDIDELTNEEEKKDKKSKKKDKKKKKKKKLSSSQYNRTTNGGMGFGGDDDGGGGGVFPSHLNDDIDDNEIEYRSKSKQNRFGMGTMQSVIHDDDDDDGGFEKENTFVNQEDGKLERNALETTENGANNTSSLYGKEALARLKAQQKSFKLPENEKSVKNESPAAAAAANGDGVATSKKSNGGGISNGEAPTNILPNNIPLPPMPKSTTVPRPPQPPVNGDGDGDDDDDIKNGSDYVSFNSSNKATSMNIITGDEALLYTGELEEDINANMFSSNNDQQQQKQKIINKANLGTETLSNVPSSKKDPFMKEDMTINGDDDNHNNDMDVDDGGRKWEEEIARRAGVSDSTSTPHATNNNKSTTTASPPSSSSSSINTTSSANVVSDVKKSIKGTLENLNQMDLDLESNIGRRGHDEEMTKEDLIKKESELKEIGDKFEYYQNLRVEMANWTGALRYVSERVNIVEKAISDLYRDVAHRQEKNWREWEDDVVSTMTEKEHMLDYIVGRQPDGETKKDEIQVDEFGRDKRSLDVLARTKRTTRRRRVRAESKDRRLNQKYITPDDNNLVYAKQFEDSDLDVSDNELMDKEERRNALCDAMNLVLNEMEEDYSTPQKLVLAFKTWRKQYESDYEQCYAKLALVELINVFVRSELCQKTDLLCLNNKEGCSKIRLNDFSWFNALEEANLVMSDEQEAGENATDDIGRSSLLNITSEIIVKEFCPLFLSVLKPQDKDVGPYDLFSTKQTNSMICFYEIITSNLFRKDEAKEKVCFSVVEHMNSFIQNLAIPIPSQGVLQIADEGAECGTDNDHIVYVTFGQLYRLRKLILNMSKWNGVLTGEPKLKLAKLCLMDVIAYRFLPIFNISEKLPWKDWKGQDIALLKEIWRCIKDVGWLEINDLLLSSAPLRAVASKLNFE